MSDHLSAREGRKRAFASLHGFSSSPRSKKNEALFSALDVHGIHLHRPDLNKPSFGDLSFVGMLAELDRMDREAGEPLWQLVGSSLGGYVAALWASAHPERVERLVLLCPAFELAPSEDAVAGGRGRWSNIVSPKELTAWERSGRRPFEDAEGRLVPLHYAFVEEAMALPAMPSPICPVLVIHGTEDVRVPIDSSRRFVAAAPETRTLIEVADGHQLLLDLPGLCAHILAFFQVNSPSGGSDEL